MPRSKETQSHVNLKTLSRESTNLILSGNFSPPVIEQVQNEL